MKPSRRMPPVADDIDVEQEVFFLQRTLNFSLEKDVFGAHITRLQSKIKNEDLRYLLETLSLRTQSVAKETAFEVGAILKLRNGRVYTGYSRESDSNYHAEEAAIQNALKAGESQLTIAGATIYSSLEPCTTRETSDVSCTELMMKYRVAKVVVAEKEDATFQNCVGEETLSATGIDFIHLPIAQGLHSKGKQKIKHKH